MSFSPSYDHKCTATFFKTQCIIVWQGDTYKVHNVKVIPNEKCVPKHKLLVMNMWCKTTKRMHKKFKPRIRIYGSSRRNRQ